MTAHKPAPRRTRTNTEREFQELLAKLPVAAYMCDPEGRITYYNRHAVRLWGREPMLHHPEERFCGSLRLLTSAGQTIPHDECWMALALKNRCEYVGREVVIERPNGQRVSVLEHVKPIFDEKGGLAGATNVLVDVTAHKNAERDQALLAAIVEGSDDAIVSKDLTGKILSWNAGAERVFGYKPEEIIGRSVLTLIPKERRNEETAIIDAISQGRRVEHFETVRVRKDGRFVDVSLTISPIRDGSGQIVGASKIARDISARKESEALTTILKNEVSIQLSDLQRLQEMGMRLWSTLELPVILQEILKTALALAGTDKGLLSLCNEQGNELELGASAGFSPDFVAAVQRVLPGAGACGTALQQHRRIVIEDIETDPLFSEYREIGLQGGIRSVHSTPLITRQGKVTGVLSVHFSKHHVPTEREKHLLDLCARQAVDFIENAKLYAQLTEADRTKNEFLATLAHELRNPLAPIRNATELLKLGVSPEDTRWSLDVIERQVQQMSRLVDDLLDIGRITRNKLELRKERAELGEAVRMAIETSKPLIEKAEQEFIVEAPQEPLHVYGDPVRLAQAVSNILNNASKYTPRGGKIHMTVEREGPVARITIRDTGIGIAPENLARIFDMFAQERRPSPDAMPSGLGIGLTLAKRLVEMHEGSITASSAGPGQGSTFTIELPLMVAGARPLFEPNEEFKLKNASKLRVLVVDDNRDAAKSLTLMLNVTNNETRIAYDGAEGLRIAEEFHPQVALLDIGMPGMDGYELARKIRARPWGKHIMLVAVTGWGQETDRARSKEAGFDRHFVKPLDLQALSSVLTSVASSHDSGVASASRKASFDGESGKAYD